MFIIKGYRLVALLSIIILQGSLSASAGCSAEFSVVPGCFDPNKFFTPKKYTLQEQKLAKKLFEAVEARHKKNVKRALAQGAPVDYTNPEGKTPLLKAAEKNDEMIAQMLLAHGADPNIPVLINPLRPGIGLYPLHIAIRNKNSKLVGLLLDHKADPFARGSIELSGLCKMPLDMAVEAGDIESLRRLFQTSCKDYFESQESVSTALLSRAAAFNNLGVSGFLISAGADVNARNHCGVTPLHLAVENENINAAKMFIRFGADVMLGQKHSNDRFHLATKSSNQDLISQLSRFQPLYRFTTEDRTPLHAACQKANIELVDLLLDHGAKETPAFGSVTPLMLLLEHADSEDKILIVLDKLLAVSNPNVPLTKFTFMDRNGSHDYMNPLGEALCKGYCRVTRKLIDWFKANNEVLDNSDACYLFGFCDLCINSGITYSHELYAILDDLLYLGADPRRQGNGGINIFHYMTGKNLDKRFVDLLAEKYPEGLTSTENNLISPEQLCEIRNIKNYKSIFTKARAAGISQAVEQDRTVCDEDGLLQEYDEQIGDVSRLLEYKTVLGSFPGFDRLQEILLKHGAKKALLEKTDLVRPGHIGNARGARFELEVAFNLYCAKKCIERFGATYDGKEFDIETPTTLYECKDIAWKIQPKKKLQTFLLEHKTIANNHGKKFKFYSRRSIPDKWKAWLSENGIKFRDTLDITSRESTQKYQYSFASSSSAASSSIN